MRLAVLYLAVLPFAVGLDPSPAHAQQATSYAARALQADCRHFAEEATDLPDIDGAFRQGICVGIFAGMVAYGPAMEPKLRFCPPEGVGYKQAMKLVLRGIDTQPDLLDEDLRNVVVAVLRHTWPCKR